MSLLKQIMEKYPSPQMDSTSDDDGYCVGGALCLFTDEGVGFPSIYRLCIVLRAANKNLTFDKAYTYACSIVSRNDAGRFDEAWDVLGDALSYGGA